MRYACFGSISEGTMKTDALLDVFAGELDYQIKRQPRSFRRREARKLINDANRCLAASADGDLPDEADYLIQELIEWLAEFSPPYAYFGSAEGDGACFGYWMSSNLMEDFDGLRVNDTSEVPRNYRGEVLHVNDHGNVSLYVATSKCLKEVWAIV